MKTPINVRKNKVIWGFEERILSLFKKNMVDEIESMTTYNCWVPENIKIALLKYINLKMDKSPI